MTSLSLSNGPSCHFPTSISFLTWFQFALAVVLPDGGLPLFSTATPSPMSSLILPQTTKKTMDPSILLNCSVLCLVRPACCLKQRQPPAGLSTKLLFNKSNHTRSLREGPHCLHSREQIIKQSVDTSYPQQTSSQRPSQTSTRSIQHRRSRPEAECLLAGQDINTIHRDQQAYSQQPISVEFFQARGRALNNPTSPSIHKTTPSKMPTRTRPSPALTLKIEHMRIPLAPLYALPDGDPHPSFPKTLLHYWLLTEDQCDSIAQWYHQTSPTHPYQSQYPAAMRWDAAFLARPDPSTMSDEEMGDCLSDEERLRVKRRMVGKFIGLRGCETPTSEISRKVKFLEDRLERSIRLERRYICPKFPG